jgi:hypothetical protein
MNQLSANGSSVNSLACAEAQDEEVKSMSMKSLDENARDIDLLRTQVEIILASAISSSALQREQQLRDFSEELSKAAEPLLKEPLSELTYKRQERLIIASALSIFIGRGFFLMTEVSLGPAKGTIPGWAAGVALALITGYFIVAFLTSVVRDLDSSKALRSFPLAHVSMLNQRSYALYADELNQVLSAAQHASNAIQKNKEDLDLLASLPEDLYDERREILMRMNEGTSMQRVLQSELESAVARKSLAETQISLAFSFVTKSQRIDRLRLIVDILFPVALAALGLYCIAY